MKLAFSFIAAATLAIAGAASAQETSFVYAGIPWGNSAGEVEEILKAKGWELVRSDQPIV